jgi:hypothetical protein
MVTYHSSQAQTESSVSRLNWNKRKEWAKTSSQQWSARREELKTQQWTSRIQWSQITLLTKRNIKFKRRSLHGSKQGGKKADHVRDWKNVKSPQQRTQFTVTDHSSWLQTGTPFLAFQRSAKGERKHPLSDELQGKNKQTPKNKTYATHWSRFLTQTAWSVFHLKQIQSSNSREWRRGKKIKTHLAMDSSFPPL